MRRSSPGYSAWILCLAAAVAAAGGAASFALGACGPFTDFTDAQFCPFVLEIFYQGITTGTTPTTYDPSANVTRLQMAAFLSRTVDGVLKRGSRRAALNRFWTPQNSSAVGLTSVAVVAGLLASDGTDIWAPISPGNQVVRLRGGDGKVLDVWTGATAAYAALPAMGYVFATGATSPGNLYRLDPTQPAGAVTTVASTLGNSPWGIAFDGARIWTANPSGSVSIVTPGSPYTVTTVTTGFFAPVGAIFDGANIWVTNFNALLKLSSGAGIIQTVPIGSGAYHPVFDGSNIWVPIYNDNVVVVVRASSGAVLAVLTGNGMDTPRAAGFDGERVLVTNAISPTVSLWRAADFKALGGFPMVGTSTGVCSDGVSFWISIAGPARIARF